MFLENDTVSDISARVIVLRRISQETMNRELGKVLDKIGHRLLSVGELFQVLWPDRTISGQNGVSQRLGISDNAVYLRLKQLALTPDDFRHPSATVGTLMPQVRGMSDWVTRALKLAGLTAEQVIDLGRDWRQQHQGSS